MSVSESERPIGAEAMRWLARRLQGAGAGHTQAGGAGAALKGLGPDTRVMTSLGKMPAAALRRRDLLRTRDGGFRAIEWIDRIKLDADYLERHPEAQPVVIRAGSLGPRLPALDLVLAPRQRLSEAQSFTGHGSGRAMAAIGYPTATHRREASITYTVFHCENPTSVLSEGIWLDVGP